MSDTISQAVPPVVGVDHIGVAVSDLDAALALFVGRLGWLTTTRGLAADGVTRMAFIALGSVELELFEVPGSPGAMLDHVALRTPDLVAAGRLLRSHGIVLLGDETEGTRGRTLWLGSESTLGLSLHLVQR